MKRPIDAANVRTGDKIRCESRDGTTPYTYETRGSGHGIVASEFVATGPIITPSTEVHYFLLDRSHVVPTRPTRGWLHFENAGPQLDTWWNEGDGYIRRLVNGRSKSTPISAVLDFVAEPAAVELPTTETLGVLTWRDEGAVSDRSETALWVLHETRQRVISESSSVPVRMVVGFTEILTHADDETAVPTAALDTLRRKRRSLQNNGVSCEATLYIDQFLAAVTEANS